VNVPTPTPPAAVSPLRQRMLEDLRRFQLHLVDTGTGPVTINATLSGLKFFFDITLGRPKRTLKMTHVAVPRKLPVILSPEEVGRPIAAAPNPKHQAAMSVAYGAGLRVSEVVSLKVGDIAAQTLQRIAADPKHLGANVGATLVLHTNAATMRSDEGLQ
jgi:integrase/recombinase XerD